MLCEQVVRALYCKPADGEWALGLDEKPCKTLSSQLRVQFLIVPLQLQGFAAHELQFAHTSCTTHASSLRTGDVLYVYGTPFPQIHAEALRGSVRFGQVSNVVHRQCYGTALWKHSQTPANPPQKCPASLHGQDSMVQIDRQQKPAPSLLLLDFKSLPGASLSLHMCTCHEPCTLISSD